MVLDYQCRWSIKCLFTFAESAPRLISVASIWYVIICRQSTTALQFCCTVWGLEGYAVSCTDTNLLKLHLRILLCNCVSATVKQTTYCTFKNETPGNGCFYSVLECWLLCNLVDSLDHVPCSKKLLVDMNSSRNINNTRLRGVCFTHTKILTFMCKLTLTCW